jgi:hypothetical protein
LKNRPLNETSFYDLPHKLKSKNHRKNATMTPIDLATASNMYLPPPSLVVANTNVQDHSTNYNFFITGAGPTPLDMI